MESCKAALQARDQEIGLCKLGLTQSLDNQSRLAVELDDANAKLSSPVHNPWFMLALGMIAGGIATGFALRGK